MTLITNVDAPATGFPGGRFSYTYASFTRPANTTAYGVGDVISDTTTAAIQFPKVGQNGAVISSMLFVEETDTINFTLWMFDQEPTNFADNAALALVSGDFPKMVGKFSYQQTTKKTVGSNLNVYQAYDLQATASVNAVLPRLPYRTPDGLLYGLLVTESSYTPISGMKFGIRLGLEFGHDA